MVDKIKEVGKKQLYWHNVYYVYILAYIPDSVLTGLGFDLSGS